MTRKVKISSNETPNRYRFWLQFSDFFPYFRAIDSRFATSWKFFWLCAEFLLLHTWFFDPIGHNNLRYDKFRFSFVSSVVIFIPARKRHLEKVSTMGEMRQIIYLRLITQMSLKKNAHNFDIFHFFLTIFTYIFLTKNSCK